MTSPSVDDMRVQQTAETVTQMREFLMSYNKLSEWCFNDCIADFTTRKLSDHENKWESDDDSLIFRRRSDYL